MKHTNSLTRKLENYLERHGISHGEAIAMTQSIFNIFREYNKLKRKNSGINKIAFLAKGQ